MLVHIFISAMPAHSWWKLKDVWYYFQSPGNQVHFLPGVGAIEASPPSLIVVDKASLVANPFPFNGGDWNIEWFPSSTLDNIAVYWYLYKSIVFKGTSLVYWPACNGKYGWHTKRYTPKKSLMSLLPLNPTLYRCCMDVVQAVES